MSGIHLTGSHGGFKSDSLVFNNRIYVSHGTYPVKIDWGGGMTVNGYNCRQDVLSTQDGTTWSNITLATPFSGRGDHRSLVYDNKMWIIGGQWGNSGLNDVWSSADGSLWSAVTGTAGFPKRYGHGAVTFENKIWVIGGK